MGAWGYFGYESGRCNKRLHRLMKKITIGRSAESTIQIQDQTVSNQHAIIEERNDRYEQQLAVYAAAGRGEGLDVTAAYLHELNDGARRAVDISAKPIAEAVAQVSIAMKGIREGQFTASPEDKKCKGCDYRLVCTHAKLRPAD